METIGKYRIEERIGSGGFGEVFKAYDPFIKRHVAIKTCGTGDQDVAERFYQEAEIGGNMHHRNITTVYDFGVHEGLPYLIQEYLSGEDLDVKIKRQDYLPYSEKLLYLLQVARGLGYAHSKGCIHRDVKPANVRILEDGTAKIMDFGIAKLAQQESGLTQTGMTLGTAAYLSPEQVRGDSVDLRTDVFSFGILAYELLTYQRPFTGEQISTVIYNLLNHEPEPITKHWPGAPPELVTLVDRCLRKDPGQRFADGNDLLRELEKLKRRGRGSQPARPVATQQVAFADAPTGPIAPTDDDQQGPTKAFHTEGLEYQPVPTAAPAAAPVAAPTATQPKVAEAPAVDAQKSNVRGFAILVVLAIAAAGVGWWLGMRDSPPETASTAPAPETEASPKTEGEAAPPSPAPTTSPPGNDPTTGSVTPVDSVPPGAKTEPVAARTDPQAGDAPEPPKAQPPPPPTAKGRLILPRVAWAEGLSVLLEGKRYGLYREHSITLPPGTYDAVFEVVPAQDSVSAYRPPKRSVKIQVTSGKSTRVRVPIQQPGALSIRPLPGRSQGQVSIDGQPIGATPLSKIQRAPGSYALEISPREGDGESLQEEVTLEAGQEVILSFDLNAGTSRTRTKDLEF